MIKNILINKFKAQIPGEFSEFKKGRIVMNYVDETIHGIADVISQDGKSVTHNTSFALDEQSKIYLEALAGKTDEFSSVEIIEFSIFPDSLEVRVYGIHDGKRKGKIMAKL